MRWKIGLLMGLSLIVLTLTFARCTRGANDIIYGRGMFNVIR
jgi:hypothetical protein